MLYLSPCSRFACCQIKLLLGTAQHNFIFFIFFVSECFSTRNWNKISNNNLCKRLTLSLFSLDQYEDIANIWRNNCIIFKLEMQKKAPYFLYHNIPMWMLQRVRIAWLEEFEALIYMGKFDVFGALGS